MPSYQYSIRKEIACCVLQSMQFCPSNLMYALLLSKRFIDSAHSLDSMRSARGLILFDYMRSEDELASTSSPEALIYDAATRMFWRNVSARSAGGIIKKTGRDPARYDIPENVPVPIVTACLTEVL